MHIFLLFLVYFLVCIYSPNHSFSATPFQSSVPKCTPTPPSPHPLNLFWLFFFFFASSLMGPHFPPLTLLATLCLHTPLLPFEHTHAGIFTYQQAPLLYSVCSISQSNHAEMQCNCASVSYHSPAPSLSCSLHP